MKYIEYEENSIMIKGNVKVRRPSPEDILELHEFFRKVITDTFIKEGIGDLLDDMAEEIKTKKDYLKKDLDSGGRDRYFLIALHGDKIVGTIEYGPPSELIKQCTNNLLEDLIEVGTVFVDPDYQEQGIGNKLLNEIYVNLRNNGINEFCLDSGYPIAQTIWKKKYGEADFLLEDYWGQGVHHMIWRIKL
jgi:GNAT superfamily N-acetyltransferase